MGISTPCTLYGNYTFITGVENTASNSTSTMLNLATIVPHFLPVGTYRIDWYLNFIMSTASADFQAQMKINGAIVMAFNIEVSDTTTNETQSGFYYFTSDGSTDYTSVALNFAAESGTATVNKGAINLWRTS